MAKRSAKFGRRKNLSTDRKNLLDTDQKRGRGRPPIVEASLIVSRANWIGGNLERAWDVLGPGLASAQDATDVARVFEQAHIGQVVSPDLFPLVLKIVRDKKHFPKRTKNQPRFLAESLAGWGVMSPSRARDVCAEERKKPAPRHILRYEFYIVCSCGYSGPSRNWGCPECPAVIPWEWRLMSGI